MVKMLTSLKYQLTHLRVGAWHQEIVEFASFGKIKRPRKACVYWWLIVPSSLPLAGIYAIVILVVGIVGFVVFSALYVLWAFGAWGLGFKPNGWFLFSKRGSDEFLMMEGDKYVRMPLSKQPFSYLGSVAFWGAVVYLHQPLFSGLAWFGRIGTQLTANWIYIIWAAGVILVLTALGAIYKYGFLPLFNRVCPDIDWVEPKESPVAD